ncbi:MAG TPA: aspartate/glutamate racemase family protein [Beijerinckiaceae bacterium]|nr:aspartate/glutamate racemase family protein [Beijerinckiaceae bacterium]
MRILLINPNTSPDLTERIAGLARAAVAGDDAIVPATGRFGARYITTRASAAIAAHAALDAFAEHGAGCDAVLLACFGDPGLAALKELSPVPVVGMAEASCHEACRRGGRFSIVTGGVLWKPMLEEFVAQLGLADRLASVRCLAQTGGDIARDPGGSLAALAAGSRAAVEADGADVVILGGAGLAGLAVPIADKVPVPVLCSFETALRAVLALASQGPGQREQRTPAPAPPTASIGLSPHLARALQGRSPSRAGA